FRLSVAPVELLNTAPGFVRRTAVLGPNTAEPLFVRVEPTANMPPVGDTPPFATNVPVPSPPRVMPEPERRPLMVTVPELLSVPLVRVKAFRKVEFVKSTNVVPLITNGAAEVRL